MAKVILEVRFECGSATYQVANQSQPAYALDSFIYLMAASLKESFHDKFMEAMARLSSDGSNELGWHFDPIDESACTFYGGQRKYILKYDFTVSFQIYTSRNKWGKEKFEPLNSMPSLHRLGKTIQYENRLGEARFYDIKSALASLLILRGEHDKALHAGDWRKAMDFNLEMEPLCQALMQPKVDNKEFGLPLLGYYESIMANRTALMTFIERDRNKPVGKAVAQKACSV